MEEHFDNTEVEIIQQEEKTLYGKAKKRVQFKVHLMIFILTNLILWLLLYFVSNLLKEEIKDVAFQFILFISLTWGVVVFAHYLIVYKWGKTLIEKEFDKLKADNKRKKKVLNDQLVNNFNS